MCYKCDFKDNCGFFKQALENSPNELRSTWGSKDVAIKICQKQLNIEQPVTFERPRVGDEIFESNMIL